MEREEAVGRVKFLETLLDNIQEPVYVLDHQGRFIYVNRALIDLAGSTKKILLSYDMYRMAQEGIIDRAVSDDVLKYKRAFSFFQDVVNFQGKHHRQLNTVTPIFDRNGNVEYIVAVILPINTLNQKVHSANEGVASSSLNLGPMKLDNKEVIAQSPAMKQVLALVQALAQVDTAVLITGETGCGKDVVAHLLHKLGPRSGGPFMEINCASLPESLLEAELFGYTPGAFTGASAGGKLGLIEAAAKGTLFLDEINSMPLSLQSKLLRALETKSFTKVGAVKSTTVDFRILAASNQDLWACTQNGTFRQDLYYRLNVMPIHIPPLRERKEDIVPLINYYLCHYGEKYGRPRCVSQHVMRQMADYDWPGNVRELKNQVERMVIMSSGDVIEISDLPSNALGHGVHDDGPWAHNGSFLAPDVLLSERLPDFSLQRYMEYCERTLLSHVLKQCGSTYKAAEYLKTNQSAIARRKAKYGL